MRLLVLKALRDFRSAWTSFGACIVMVALTVSLFAAFTTASQSLKDSCDEVYRRLHFLDFTLILHESPPTIAQRLKSVSGVDSFEARQKARIKILLDPPSVTASRARFITGDMFALPHDRRPVVNDVHVVEGRYLSEPHGEILLEQRFAKIHRLGLGESVRIGTTKGVFPFRIVGLVHTPEYLWMATSTSDPIPKNGNHIIAFASEKDLNKLAGKVAINNIHVRISPGAELKDVMARATHRFQDVKRRETRPRDEQPSHSLLVRDQRAFTGMAIVFPSLLLLLSALSIHSAMAQLLLRQRRQIGILMSQGFSNGQILGHYAVTGLVVSSLGLVVGLFGGIWLGDLCTRFYADTLGIPFVQVTLPWGRFILVTAVIYTTAVVAVVKAGYSLLQMNPVTALRENFQGSRKVKFSKRFFSRLGLPISLMIAVRNLSRNPGRTWMSIFGICFAAVQMTMSLSLFSSQEQTLKFYFEESHLYTFRIKLDRVYSPTELAPFERWEGVEQVEPFLSLKAEIRGPEKTVKKTVLGLPKNAQLVRYFAEDGQERVYPSPDTVLLGPLTGKELALSGTQVELELLHQRSHPTAKFFRLDTKLHDPISGPARIPLSDLQHMSRLAYNLPPDGVSGFWLLVDDKHREAIYQRLLREPGVKKVSSPQQLRSNIEDLLRMFSAYKYLVMAFTLVFAVVILAGTTILNTVERSRELATLSCLGVSDFRIWMLLFREVLILWLLGTLFGIPLGVWAGDWLVNSYQNDLLKLDLHLDFVSVAGACAFSLSICILAQLLAWFRLGRIPLTAATQERFD